MKFRESTDERGRGVCGRGGGGNILSVCDIVIA